MTDQNPPEGAERYEWLGTNIGSITRTNPDTGTSYRVGHNMDDRFVWIAADDLAWAQSQPEAFRAAPLDTDADAAPTKPSSKSKSSGASGTKKAATKEPPADPSENPPVDPTITDTLLTGD